MMQSAGDAEGAGTSWRPACTEMEATDGASGHLVEAGLRTYEVHTAPSLTGVDTNAEYRQKLICHDGSCHYLMGIRIPPALSLSSAILMH